MKKLENRQLKHMKEHNDNASIATLRGYETTMNNVKAGSERSVASSQFTSSPKKRNHGNYYDN